MSSFCNFSSNQFFIGTTFKNDHASDKDSFLSVLDKRNINKKYITDANQIHSNIVSFVNKPGTYDNIDGLITNSDSKLILVIKTADCVPIFFFDKIENNYGAIHAGWRGIQKKIHLNAVDKFLSIGSNIENINIIIGPSIKPCCYEVGAEMKKIFNEKFITTINNKYYLDLIKCIVSDLKVLGIKNININSSCTYDDDKYYSYRKDKGNGRMYSFITII